MHPMLQPPNARLWVFWNDAFTKITLKPGQTVKFSRFARDEEGHSTSGAAYHHEGDRLTALSGFSGRDCDGPISESHEQECAIADLRRHRVADNWPPCEAPFTLLDEKGQWIHIPEWRDPQPATADTDH